MKAVSTFLNRTPWWVLIVGGFALLAALALFTTPFHVIQLDRSGATPEENRAIKSEINAAFSESAIDLARGVVKEILDHTKDPTRREELGQALQELDQARESLREAGAEVLRAKRRGAEDLERDKIHKSIDEPLPDIDVGSGTASPGTPLAPELKKQIRKKVSGDLHRIGIGAALIVLFIPLFVLTIVSKFFIDRSRAAQDMAESIRKEADYHRMSRQVTEAKLSALQAQVEPHFLYNTLASVQALTEVDPKQAHAMTGHLIQYLRNALPKMRESVSTVGQEIELVRAYLNIFQMRMGKRLAFEIDVPLELMDAAFPPLMLPSLVENAIKHGLEPQREGGKVVIRARANGTLRMSVCDTGRGFAQTVGAGVGLANIRERLAALYADAGKLTLEAGPSGGAEATIEVPRESTRPAGAAALPLGAAQAGRPALPRSAAAKTLAAMGTAERAWRKGLSFAFIVLVVMAAVFAGLAMVGVATGIVPVQVGEGTMGGATGALIGTAGIAAAFAVVVLCLAIVLALVYGMGFLFLGLAIFIPLVVLVSLFPVFSPFILLGLGIWWLVRRKRGKSEPADGGTKA